MTDPLIDNQQMRKNPKQNKGFWHRGQSGAKNFEV
jgi:hypothetical protein